MRRSAAAPDAGALAIRLAAALLVTGGVVFLLAAFAISRLDLRTIDSGEAYVVPGGAMLDPAIVTLLIGCGGTLAVLGFLLGASNFIPRRAEQAQTKSAWISRASGHPATEPGSALPTVSHSWRRRRAMLVLFAGITLLAAALSHRWHHNGSSGLPISGSRSVR